MKQIISVIILFIFISASPLIAGSITIYSGAGQHEIKDSPSKENPVDKAPSREDRIQELEAKVRPLPASDITGNLSIYKKLLELDPGNDKYKNKVNYYTQKKIVARERKAERKKEKAAERIKKRAEIENYNISMRSKSDVEILSWNWGVQAIRFVIAEGLIRNVSGRTLNFLKINVRWYGKNKKYVTHSISYADLTSIKNGQESTFKVMTTYNPKMSSASISFLIRGEEIKSFTKK